jgi:hypothetical protein
VGLQLGFFSCKSGCNYLFSVASRVATEIFSSRKDELQLRFFNYKSAYENDITWLRTKLILSQLKISHNAMSWSNCNMGWNREPFHLLSESFSSTFLLFIFSCKWEFFLSQICNMVATESFLHKRVAIYLLSPPLQHGCAWENFLSIATRVATELFSQLQQGWNQGIISTKSSKSWLQQLMTLKHK